MSPIPGVRNVLPEMALEPQGAATGAGGGGGAEAGERGQAAALRGKCVVSLCLGCWSHRQSFIQHISPDSDVSLKGKGTELEGLGLESRGLMDLTSNPA